MVLLLQLLNILLGKAHTVTVVLGIYLYLFSLPEKERKKVDNGFIACRRDKTHIVELVSCKKGFSVVTRKSGTILDTTIFCDKAETAVMIIQGHRQDYKRSGWKIVNLAEL